jgi:hypothetical protein
MYDERDPTNGDDGTDDEPNDEGPDLAPLLVPSGLVLDSDEGAEWLLGAAKDVATALASQRENLTSAFVWASVDLSTGAILDEPDILILPCEFYDDESCDKITAWVRDTATASRATAVVFVSRAWITDRTACNKDGLSPSEHPERQSCCMLTVCHRRWPGNHARSLIALITHQEDGPVLGEFVEAMEVGTCSGRFVELMPELESD